MRVSPSNYSEATRAAVIILAGIYAGAGILMGFSTRNIEIAGTRYILALLAALAICNGIIFLFQRLSLPKAEALLQHAITTRDGDGFARHIIRREMAKRLQPVGGIAFSIGFLAAIIACRLAH